MDISIVIPVYNEEENLGLLYKQLKVSLDSLNRTYEIIFVDDGSTDNSYKILKKINYKDSHIRIIRFVHNFGRTSALDAGFRNVEGDLVITIDSDLQIDPKDIIKLLRELEYFDVVLGYRYNRKEVDGIVRFYSSRIANYIRNAILKESFRDVGCSLQGYKKKCLDSLVLYRSFQFFIPSLLNMSGYKIKEIKIECFKRKYGRSKYNIRNRLFKELVALLIVKWMKKNKLDYKLMGNGK